MEINFEYDTEINLIAEPSPGWSFERWHDTELEDPYSSNLVFQPNSDTAINAYFIKNDYGLIVNDGTGGPVEGGGSLCL